jgi:hypothetical protein
MAFAYTVTNKDQVIRVGAETCGSDTLITGMDDVRAIHVNNSTDTHQIRAVRQTDTNEGKATLVGTAADTGYWLAFGGVYKGITSGTGAN